MARIPEKPLPLDRSLLERLERRLRADGAEPLDGVHAGLSDEDVASFSDRLPAPLPAELQLWWTWRTWGGGVILPGVQYQTLEMTLDHYDFRRQYAEEQSAGPSGAAIPSERWWSLHWLPVLVGDGGVVLATDLELGDGQIAPLRQVNWQWIGLDSYARVVAGSLGDFVERRLNEFDAGNFVFNRAAKMWFRPSRG